eukprot:jgi/Mesvir1/5566/Mv15588-RA.1
MRWRPVSLVKCQGLFLAVTSAFMATIFLATVTASHSPIASETATSYMAPATHTTPQGAHGTARVGYSDRSPASDDTDPIRATRYRGARPLLRSHLHLRSLLQGDALDGGVLQADALQENTLALDLLPTTTLLQGDPSTSPAATSPLASNQGEKPRLILAGIDYPRVDFDFHKVLNDVDARWSMPDASGLPMKGSTGSLELDEGMRAAAVRACAWYPVVDAGQQSNDEDGAGEGGNGTGRQGPRRGGVQKGGQKEGGHGALFAHPLHRLGLGHAGHLLRAHALPTVEVGTGKGHMSGAQGGGDAGQDEELPIPPGVSVDEMDGRLRRRHSDGVYEAYMPRLQPYNHGSTMELLPGGEIVVAWHAGNRVEEPDVSVMTAIRKGARHADMRHFTRPHVTSQKPGWSNHSPVLFFDAESGILHLYHASQPGYVASNTPVTLQHVKSLDGKGASWTKPEPFPAGVGCSTHHRIVAECPSLHKRGVCRDKDARLPGSTASSADASNGLSSDGVAVGNSTWLFPVLVNPGGWRASYPGLLLTKDMGATWSQHTLTRVEGLIQPALVLIHASRLIQKVADQEWLRAAELAQSSQGLSVREEEDLGSGDFSHPRARMLGDQLIWTCDLDHGGMALLMRDGGSDDISSASSANVLVAFFASTSSRSLHMSMALASDGTTWSLPCAVKIRNNDGGFAVTELSSGALAIVYNNCFLGEGRLPLTISLSEDGGRTWPHSRDLESLETLPLERFLEPAAMYHPAILQTPDGKIHVTYTYDSQTIKYVEIDEEWIKTDALDLFSVSDMA